MNTQEAKQTSSHGCKETLLLSFRHAPYHDRAVAKDKYLCLVGHCIELTPPLLGGVSIIGIRCRWVQLGNAKQVSRVITTLHVNVQSGRRFISIRGVNHVVDDLCIRMVRSASCIKELDKLRKQVRPVTTTLDFWQPLQDR